MPTSDLVQVADAARFQVFDPHMRSPNRCQKSFVGACGVAKSAPTMSFCSTPRFETRIETTILWFASSSLVASSKRRTLASDPSETVIATDFSATSIFWTNS